MANAESKYMGGRKAKLWTYMILMIVLVIGAVIVNYAVRDPELAKKGVESFMGLPRWAFPSIGLLVGLGVYWIGLKIETDWPEAVGAFLIAGSVAAGEFLIGWQKFAFAGMVGGAVRDPDPGVRDPADGGDREEQVRKTSDDSHLRRRF